MARLWDKMNKVVEDRRLQSARNHLYNLWVCQEISWDEMNKRLKELRENEKNKK